MSLEAIAQQTGGSRSSGGIGSAGGRSGRMSRSLKQDGGNNGDVDMEANSNNTGGNQGGRRRDNNNNRNNTSNNRQLRGRNRRGSGGGGQDLLSNIAGGSQVIVVNSIEEATRLANRGGGISRMGPGQGGNGNNSSLNRQNEHAFRNFSSNRRQNRKRQPGVLVRIEGLDKQIIAEELSDLVKQEFPNSFLRAYLEYDNTERSLGRGGIYFKTYEDAQNAIEVFSSKRLDGKPMCLYLAEGNEHRYNNNDRFDSQPPQQQGGRRAFSSGSVNNGNNNMNSQRW